MPPLEAPLTTERFDEISEVLNLPTRENLVLVGRWQMRSYPLDLQMLHSLEHGHRFRKFLNQKSATPHAGINRQMHLQTPTRCTGELIEVIGLRDARQTGCPILRHNFRPLGIPCRTQQINPRINARIANPPRLADIRHPQKCHPIIGKNLGHFFQAMTISRGLHHRHHLSPATLTRDRKISPQCSQINFRPCPRRRYGKLTLHAPSLTSHPMLASSCLKMRSEML